MPGRLAGEAALGTTKAAHSLTRGHNRKVICDAAHRRWYIFWLRDDGKPAFNKDEEGVVYQASSDGLTWSRPIVVEPFQNGGITAWDVVSAGGVPLGAALTVPGSDRLSASSKANSANV
jgi:hypothetical protein